MAACGAYHTTAVSEEGDLWTWGKGDDGALGHNTREHKLTPLRISHARSFAGSRVVMSAAGSCKSAPGSGAPGSFHSAAVTEDGGVWTWGEGIDGRLGHGNEDDRLQPSRLGGENFAGNPIYMVACGGSHTAALAVGGRLWTWGSGFLGHNDKIKRLVPTRVEGAECFSRARIATVAVGTAHTITATAEGDVYTWGRGKYGRLGHGDEEDRLAPTLIERHNVSGASSANVGAFKGGHFKGVLAGAGFNHSVLVTVGGTLWAWGDGCSGRLGLGDRDQRLSPVLVGGDETFGSQVVTAACGSAHTLAVTKEGSLWAWGYGAGGRLGTKDNKTRLLPTRVKAHHLGNARVCQISAGSVHSIAMTQDGGLWTFGPAQVYAGAFKNVQVPTGLGHGDMRDKLVPTRLQLQGVAFGRCQRLGPERALAFAMSCHTRLGRESACSLQCEVVRRIVLHASSWPEGPAAKHDGVLRFIGGARLLTLLHQQHKHEQEREVVKVQGVCTLATLLDTASRLLPPPVPPSTQKGEGEEEEDEEDMSSPQLVSESELPLRGTCAGAPGAFRPRSGLVGLAESLDDEEEDEEEEDDEAKKNKDRGCRCGRTKCLKQYCQCFRNDVRCSPQCVCSDCHNDGAHEEKRIEAIRRIRMTNFRAFRGTDLEIEDVSVVTASGSVKLIRGCRCKRSRCKKKYCECYAAALPCTTNCVCKNCDNGNDAGKLWSVEQIMKPSRAFSGCKGAASPASASETTALSTPTSPTWASHGAYATHSNGSSKGSSKGGKSNIKSTIKSTMQSTIKSTIKSTIHTRIKTNINTTVNTHSYAHPAKGASLDSGRAGAGKSRPLVSCSSAMATASSSSYASVPPHFSDSEDEKTNVASLLTTLTSPTRLAPAAGRAARGKRSKTESDLQDVADVAYNARGPRQDELSALLAAGIATDAMGQEESEEHEEHEALDDGPISVLLLAAELLAGPSLD